MSGRIVLSRPAAGVAEVRIDNPGKYNAMSLSMWTDLDREVRALHQDREVRVLLLRGEGDRAFVSGADISEFDRTRSAETGSEVYDHAVEAAQAALTGAPFPVVACIHGVCMGGGLGLALACDLRYASLDARLRMPAARLGLGYSYGGIRQMVTAIGSARTAELFYTARTVTGAEAERMALVHAAYPAHELDAAVAGIAAGIAENAPLTLRLAKAAIRAATAEAGSKADADIEHARKLCVASADYAEGRRAFAEKRAPRFVGA